MAALVLLTKMPMKFAVGTSLFIIAAKSLLGFIGDLQGDEIIDRDLLLMFTILSILGVFIGIYLSKKIEGKRLSVAFRWFVLLMGIYILIRELFLKQEGVQLEAQFYTRN
nr:sulfite exporter TauE/SafE family protein [Sphingobacterium sp. xlx-73]